ncbi:hypothetical protein [Rosistilla oblonga]|uniref:hypothetical protein n=1 Tax=Rosistilla oblonga TaxID=2527990 RepID=UPI003A97904F
MDSGSPKVIFTSVENDPDQLQSHPLRVSGIISMLLGLISVVALAGPYMWIVPILAIAAALIALRPSKLPYAGRSFALVGLGLAIFFGSWAVAAQNAADQIQLQTAKRFAQNWLDSFKTGEVEFCFEMSLAERDRLYKSVNLSRYYAEKTEPDENADMPPSGPVFSDFITQPLVKTLINADKKPEWEFEGATDSVKMAGSRRWTLRFRDTSGTIADPVLVTLSFQRDYDGEQHWEINNFETPE